LDVLRIGEVNGYMGSSNAKSKSNQSIQPLETFAAFKLGLCLVITRYRTVKLGKP